MMVVAAAVAGIAPEEPFSHQIRITERWLRANRNAKGHVNRRIAGITDRYLGAAGEVVGTGLIAPVVSAFLVAPFLMKKAIPLFALVPSFLASTLAGAALGILALNFLKRADIIAPGE